MGMGQVTSYPCSSHQTSWDLWMFIPLKQWHVSIYGDISYVHITIYGIKLDIYIYLLRFIWDTCYHANQSHSYPIIRLNPIQTLFADG